MKTQNHFNIVVLEDSEFYNNILSRKLQNHTSAIAFGKDFSFDIYSYTNINDCLCNLNSNTDIAFVDYYLGDSKNALHIIKKIKQKCSNCKIIIISQSKSIKASLQVINEGVYDFIYKDNTALMRSCYIVEKIIDERLR
jgi:DNA-binding NtrC family response regulator